MEEDIAGTYIDIKLSDTGRFEAIFVMLVPRATLSTLRPFLCP